jgi:hypothetical protein
VRVARSRPKRKIRRTKPSTPSLRATLSVVTTNRVYSPHWVHERLRSTAKKIDGCYAKAKLQRLLGKPAGWRLAVSAKGRVKWVKPLGPSKRSGRLVRCMKKVLRHIRWGRTHSKQAGNFEVHFTAQLLATR